MPGWRMMAGTGRSSWVLPTAIFVLLLAAAYFWLPLAKRHPKSVSAPTLVESQTQTPSTQPAERAHVPAPAFSIEADGTAVIPARFQLPGVSRVKSGANSAEWLAQYPPDQQVKIKAFDKAHFGLYSINSPQQVAWMAQNGYPMPEDVIAAEKLTDTDLRELAKQGNDKAGFLLRERNIADTVAALATYHAQGKTTEDFWTNDPAAKQLSLDASATLQLLRQSSSPYKGYVQALDSLREDSQVGKDAAVIAGLGWAQSLGDFRANQFLETYVGDDPVRLAMFATLLQAKSNASNDQQWMQNNGCAKTGVPPGMSIPGNFAPVE